MILFEIHNQPNIINAGKTSIVIKDVDGNEIDRIHPFDHIVSQFLKTSIMNKRTLPDAKKWFEGNFYNWIKGGAQDRHDDMMNEKLYQQAFYVPLEEYINSFLHAESALASSKKLSRDIIFNSLPEFVKKNPANAVVFSGGRLFRLRKIIPQVQQLHDYIITVVQTKEQRNDTLMPPQLMVNNLTTLQVPEAFKRSVAWHNYLKQQAEKVSIEKAKQLAKGLKDGVDYKVLFHIDDNLTVVQLTSEKSAEVEGTIMKHCVASYGRDIAKGRSIIWSIRTPDKVPIATLEMKGNHAAQVQGPHDSTINPNYHEAIRKFLIKNKISVEQKMLKNFGGFPNKEKGEQ